MPSVLYIETLKPRRTEVGPNTAFTKTGHRSKRVRRMTNRNVPGLAGLRRSSTDDLRRCLLWIHLDVVVSWRTSRGNLLVTTILSLLVDKRY